MTFDNIVKGNYIEFDANSFACSNRLNDKHLQVYEYYEGESLVLTFEQIIGNCFDYNHLYKLLFKDASGADYSGLVVGISPSKYKVIIVPQIYIRFDWEFNSCQWKLCVSTVRKNVNGQLVSSVFSIDLKNVHLDNQSLKVSEIFNHTSNDEHVSFGHFLVTESKDHCGNIAIGVHDTFNNGLSIVPEKFKDTKYLYQNRFFYLLLIKSIPHHLPIILNRLLFYNDTYLANAKIDDIEGMITYRDPTVNVKKHWANYFAIVYKETGNSNILKSGVCNMFGNIVIPMEYNRILSCGKYILADSDIFKINKDLTVTKIYNGYHLHFTAIMNGYFVFEKSIKGNIKSFLINSEGRQERIESNKKLLVEKTNGDIIYYDCTYKRFLYKYYNEGASLDETSLPVEDKEQMYRDAFDNNPELEWNID